MNEGKYGMGLVCYCIDVGLVAVVVLTVIIIVTAAAFPGIRPYRLLGHVRCVNGEMVRGSCMKGRFGTQYLLKNTVHIHSNHIPTE